MEFNVDHFVELKRKNGKRELFKLEAVRTVCEAEDPKNCMINTGEYEISYDSVKQLLEAHERYHVYGLEMGAALETLAKTRVDRLMKQFGKEKTISFIKELMDCQDLTEVYQLQARYEEELKDNQQV